MKTNYSTKCDGIGGLIKRRISDFIVEEITPDGKVCEVKCFTAEEKKECELKVPANPGNGEEQLVLVLEKFNSDQQNAIRKVTRFLQVSNNRIGYAGLKDKRAITSQRISIWNPDAGKLENFKSRYIALRDPKWGKDRVEIGGLKGNRFTITVRDVRLGEKELKERIGNCFKEMENGIANYFGEQRFGGAREVTHLVGKEFVRGNFEDGVMLYLTATFPLEEEDVKNARIGLAKTRDFSKAIREFPAKFRYERSIIHHLCKYPSDYIGAFRKLPKHMQYLFTHAYQSLLFNRIIERRFEEGMGLGKVDGDILDNGIPTVPLLGFESEFAEGKAGEIEKEVLCGEGLTLEDFRIREFPELSAKGGRKRIALFPEGLRLIKVEEDELNEGSLKAVVSFSLEKGSYATTVLRELMKVE